MKCNAERLIRALIGADLMAERRHAEQEAAQQKKATYVVTISRGYGAQGKEVAQALADHLGVRCCDRSILQEVARRAHVDIELVETLDEHVKHIEGDWWQAFFSGKIFSREQYFHHLVKVILSISRRGGVIVGRGAHLILGCCQAFRVRIIGSPPSCAERIALRENLTHEAATERVRQVNQERAEYIKALYDADIDATGDYDLVLNSDRFSVEQMVDMILVSMGHAGYSLPQENVNSEHSLS